MRKQAFGVVGASFHATTTGGSFKVPQPVLSALLGVWFPHLVAIEHDLVSETDRSTRTLSGTFSAFLTEVLKTEVDVAIGGER